MKKFLISEEEKNRILGMHQEATKRHYLNEQKMPTFTPALAKEIYDQGNALFNAGNKNRFFTAKSLPGIVFQMSMEKETNFQPGNIPLYVYQAYKYPSKPVVIKQAGQLFINSPKGANDTTYTPEFQPAQLSNTAEPYELWPVSIMPKNAVEYLIKYRFDTLTPEQKNEVKQYVQNTADVPAEYKTFVESLS